MLYVSLIGRCFNNLQIRLRVRFGSSEIGRNGNLEPMEHAVRVPAQMGRVDSIKPRQAYYRQIKSKS